MCSGCTYTSDSRTCYWPRCCLPLLRAQRETSREGREREEEKERRRIRSGHPDLDKVEVDELAWMGRPLFSLSLSRSSFCLFFFLFAQELCDPRTKLLKGVTHATRGLGAFHLKVKKRTSFEPFFSLLFSHLPSSSLAL